MYNFNTNIIQHVCTSFSVTKVMGMQYLIW